MALFITGDLHGRSYIGKLDRFREAFGGQLTKDDVLLVLGDFCVPWTSPATDADRELIRKMDAFPWTTAFIDGNHENFDVLDALPSKRMFGATVGRLSDSIYHLRRGRTYTICGHRTLAMGGAISKDKGMLRKAGSWWPQEVATEAQRKACDRSVRANRDVDIVVTHAAPTRQLIEHARSCETEWKPDEFNDWLQTHVADRVDFRQWFYGHMHDDRPWEAPYTPLMHVIYDVDSAFEGQLWGPGSLMDDWYPGEPF